MYLSNAFLRRQLSSFASLPDQPGVITRGESNLGFSETIQFADADVFYSREITFFSTIATVELILSTGQITSTAGTQQVESATCVGTITVGGNLEVTLTSERFAAPVIVAVAVATSDLAADWAVKVASALNANATISQYFTASNPSSGVVALTSILPYRNDATLNIAIAAGTATGITTAPTSANTTTGVGGAVVTPHSDAVDVHGVAIPLSWGRYLAVMALEAGIGIAHPAAGINEFFVNPNGIFDFVIQVDAQWEDITEVPWVFSSGSATDIPAARIFYVGKTR